MDLVVLFQKTVPRIATIFGAVSVAGTTHDDVLIPRTGIGCMLGTWIASFGACFKNESLTWIPSRLNLQSKSFASMFFSSTQ